MGKIDFDHYSKIICGLSGGKDSTAAALALRFESGANPEQIEFLFCDTKNEDSLTYAYIEAVANVMAPARLVVLESEGFLPLAQRKKRFPSARARFCTEYLKIRPALAYLAAAAAAGRVLNVSGVRADEATVANGRGDLIEFEREPDLVGVDVWRAVYRYSMPAVLDAHRRHLPPNLAADLVSSDPNLAPEHKRSIIDELGRVGAPINPLYAMGARRVGCFPCIMSRKNEVRAMALFRPERVIELAQWEASVPNENGISTFFAKNAVPQRFATVETVAADGATHMVPSIYDVVLWSKTAWGARQFELFANESAAVAACDLVAGAAMCE